MTATARSSSTRTSWPAPAKPCWRRRAADTTRSASRASCTASCFSTRATGRSLRCSSGRTVAPPRRRRSSPSGWTRPRVHARTGCFLHPSFWPAKLAWLGSRVAEASRIVSFADYLFLRLTGELRTTLSTASGTGLLDLRARRWDAELLGELQIDESMLPPIGDEAAGTAFPPLADGVCSNLGAGCTTRERAALMIGTSGALRVLYEGRPEPRPGLFCYLLDDRRILEGGAVSDGGNLYAWLERTLRADDPEPREPDGHGLTFLTLLGGERSPGWNPRATGAIAGLSFDTDSSRPLPGCAGRRDVPAGGDRRTASGDPRGRGHRPCAPCERPLGPTLRGCSRPSGHRLRRRGGLGARRRAPGPRTAWAPTPSLRRSAACTSRIPRAPRSTPKPGGASASSTTVCMYLDSYVTVLVHSDAWKQSCERWRTRAGEPC